MSLVATAPRAARPHAAALAEATARGPDARTIDGPIGALPVEPGRMQDESAPITVTRGNAAARAGPFAMNADPARRRVRIATLVSPGVSPGMDAPGDGTITARFFASAAREAAGPDAVFGPGDFTPAAFVPESRGPLATGPPTVLPVEEA